MVFFTDIVDISRDVQYAVVAGKPLCLDLYLPRRSHRLGAVLLFHGGGPNGGDKGGDTGGLAKYLAGEGFLCVDIAYRVSTDFPTGTSNSIRFREQLKDAEAARAWLTKQADRYRFDPSAIISGGASSGASIALNLAGCRAYVDLWGPTAPLARIGSAIFIYGTQDHAYSREALARIAINRVHKIAVEGYGHALPLDARVGDDMLYKHIADYLLRLLN